MKVIQPYLEKFKLQQLSLCRGINFFHFIFLCTFLFWEEG
jgi:hypothetical protein